MTTDDTNGLDPIGTPEIAKIRGVAVGTVTSWRNRGTLAPPDQVVSGVAVWRRAAIEDPDGEHEPLPRLVSLQEVARMFGVDLKTVNMWRYRDRTGMWKNIRLPVPVGNVGNRPLWLPAQWIPFAEQTGRTIDLSALDQPDEQPDA